YIFFLMTLVVFFSFWTNPGRRTDSKVGLALFSIIVLSLVTSYLFNSEHRYIYGFVFAIYLMAVEALFAIVGNLQCYVKKLLISVFVLLCILFIAAGYSELRKLEMREIIHLKVRPHNLSLNERIGYVDLLNFPFEKELTHQILGELGYKDAFDAELAGRFEMQAAGALHLFVYCEEGFELHVDQKIVLSRYERNDEKELETMISLEEGPHTFKLIYYHKNFDSGIKAMYVPLMDDVYGKHYFGQDSRFVTFRTPDRSD
ncbi:MAG: hypothetical protein WAU91_08100, partial [Desulfatitalea sp.]